MIHTDKIGKNLKQIRDMSGLSRQAFAEILGVSYQQIQKYETGENRLSAESLHILKTKLCISYDAFFKGISIDPQTEEISLKVLNIFKNIKSTQTKNKAYEILKILAE